MKIIFLGTGDAFCSDGRANTSIFIESEHRILLDCSPQAVYNLKKTGRKVSDIEYIFLSHLHGDHAGGLPFIVLNLLFKEQGTITVSGPQATKDFTEQVYQAYYGIRSAPEVLIFKPLDSPYPFQIRYVRARHPVEAYVYKITLEGKTIVYTGDTSPLDLKSFAHGADLLVHEASENSEERAEAYGHSTPTQAASVAAEAQVRQLALVHSPYLDDEARSRVRQIFRSTLFPQDLDEIIL